MPNNKNRLDKISTQLTSRQQVYMLIDKSREFQTMDDFIAWFLEDENHPELANVFGHSAELVKEQMKGQSPERIQEAVKKSYREGQFLFSLNSRVAFSFHSDFYRHAYNSLMLVDLMRQWMLDSAKREENATLDDIQDVITNLKTWKNRATRHLYDLYHEKLLAEAISNKHFGGRQLLFENDRLKLERFIQQVETLIYCQNENTETCLNRTKASEYPEVQEFAQKFKSCLVDIDAVIEEVKVDLPAAIEREEQMAKMDVYSGEDQHDKAMAILRQYGAMSA